MKAALRKIPQITEEEPAINKWTSLNTFGPHAKLRPGELRVLRNYDIFGDYIKSRRGSQILIEDFCPNRDILNHVVFDAGAREYAIIQQKAVAANVSEFRFVELISSGTWTDVLNKSGLTSFTIATSDKVDMMVSNGKVYIFSTLGNSILEYDLPNLRFLRRKLGLPGPQITEVIGTPESVADQGFSGKRVYGAELVYKDTTVTPNVDIIVSGPNRAILVSNPTFREGRLAYAEGTDREYTVKISPTLNDGSLITATENGNWTHIRLYRSKDLTTATNAVPDLQGSAEVIGQEDELFQVQELDKATFLATLSGGVYSFSLDNIQDDDMPFPNDLVAGDRLDLYPIPKCDVGTFHRNRVWVSGALFFPGPNGDYALEAMQSKIFFSPEVDTKYSEQSQALTAIESEPGDGQRMIKLISFQEDLLGIKEGKTGIVPYGDPNSGWVTEDHAIGIEDRDFAQFVPNVGICAIVNDQNDFRIFGYDHAWHQDFEGLQISRPIRNVVKTFTPADIDFFYMNGKLFISGGQAEMLILAVEQKKGWSTYLYPFNSLSEAAFTFDEGRQAVVLNKGQKGIAIEVDDLDTDYNVTTTGLTDPIDCFLTTHRWQADGGRSIIEQRWLSIVAVIEKQLSAQPFVNGKLFDVPFQLLLNPQDYPDIALRETEYQGYSEFKPIANYIHYDLTATAPVTIYSIMLNCLIQRGQIAPGFDPFGVLDLAQRTPSWANLTQEKDAATENRTTSNFVLNDAGTETRTTADFRQDDAGTENR